MRRGLTGSMMSPVNKILAVLVLSLSGCVLYGGDDAPQQADAGADAAELDVDAGAPDACPAPLCEQLCPAQYNCDTVGICVCDGPFVPHVECLPPA